MANLQLHFNGNFPFKKEEIRRIIQVATEDKGLKDDLENLMKKTGLGNAKVGKIKSWASRAGLIKDYHLSEEGKIVFRLDSSLENLITDWLMHFYLSFGDKGLKEPPENLAEWGGWPYFVHVFLPHNRQFTSQQFVSQTQGIFEEKAEVIADRLKYILRTYTEKNALAGCNIIQNIDKNTYQTGPVNLPNAYLIGYFLAKLWKRDFQNSTSELTETILQQKMGLSTILGIETEALQEQLNTLEAYGIIEQRRTVPPFQIVRRWDDALTLLEKAYANHQ
ncbi:DUF4007 family protein [Ancylothrix sp. C2]|uniref:DUF4007 family protein n=1 Tax=Ancylothrix sp. D3o TaxID=2953691 RepID=UPI0021BA91BD|nr:DUF4007 family protein [Ancylothrix sp. D3o]MCT7951493.1 DUF4007 family protein [Ancylothrix sp. D3o]